MGLADTVLWLAAATFINWASTAGWTPSFPQMP
jgi:hypothetical protein